MILIVPVALIAVLAVGAFALRHAEGHASELREALLLLLMLAVVSASIGLMSLRPSDASRDVLQATVGSVSA
ncbi:hypothetical protein R1A27_13430 [Methylobacterium sp. NMS12]|uniref:hypothetical protein n=1 Tax=Methylobacterium sp. NMS12 TaxID=3079766 RepID=UPI003F884930